MTIYEKVDVLRESLRDYLSVRNEQATVFAVCGEQLDIFFYRVKLFSLSNRELKPSLLDTYAYIIARVIHVNYELSKVMKQEGDI